MNNQEKSWFLLLFIWIISLIATSGSIYFSEVMGYVPCTLCWYQRIAMYPLVIIFLVALYLNDKSFKYFTFPIVLIGWIISIYHNLLYYHFIQENISVCRGGIPCTTSYISWFGFISIPLLALTGFTLILGLLIIWQREID